MRGKLIADFFVDWVLVALIPVWLILGFSLLLRDNPAFSFESFTVATALFGYAIALVCAFLDESPFYLLRQWRAFHLVLLTFARIIKWGTIVVAVACISVFTVAELIVDKSNFSISGQDALWVASILSLAAFLFSVLAILTKRADVGTPRVTDGSI